MLSIHLIGVRFIFSFVPLDFGMFPKKTPIPGELRFESALSFGHRVRSQRLFISSNLSCSGDVLQVATSAFNLIHRQPVLKIPRKSTNSPSLIRCVERDCSYANSKPWRLCLCCVAVYSHQRFGLTFYREKWFSCNAKRFFIIIWKF